MIIAQITDFHVRPRGVMAYGGIDTNEMLRRAVAAIAALDPAPDCVLATGDLADCGLPAEYREIDAMLASLPMPTFVIPGNHDRRDVMRESLGDRHPYLHQHADFLQYVIDDYPVRAADAARTEVRHFISAAVSFCSRSNPAFGSISPRMTPVMISRCARHVRTELPPG